MEIRSVDINCDVGEGVAHERHLFPYLNSCNIACGGHTGDIESITRTIQFAKQHQVKIGAHPSYPDSVNFGRKSITISKTDLTKSIKQQIHTFLGVLKEQEAQLHHIKPHGALYNDVAANADLAQVFLESIASLKESAYLYSPYESKIAVLAKAQGFKLKYEAFADRNYENDRRLVARSLPNALLHEPEQILQHILPMVTQQRVKTIHGDAIAIKADTICIHGDNPAALQILAYLSEHLPKKGIACK